MKKLRTILLAFTALFFLSASCDKQDPEPVFTQGFSCKINGVEWVAKTPASIGGPVALDPFFNESSGSVHLKATIKDNEEDIYDIINIFGIINTINLSEAQLTVLDADGNEQNGYFAINSTDICNAYSHDSLNPGNLKICVFNKEKREISGTFSMTLINRDCADSLMQITDGKFAFWY